MSYIGTKKRVTVRPVPEPIRKPVPAPERIEVPNWPIAIPIPVEMPVKVEVQ